MPFFSDNKQIKDYLKFFVYSVLLFLFPLLSYADTIGVVLTDTSNGALFTPSPADQSIMYLGELFGNVPPVLAGTGSGLMGKLFSSFNTAVMSLGIFFAGYTTFVGILNTAGEGEMLGKGWNSIWVPIKTVAGIALLIPTASGYCICQIFMMWLLVQGIGAADTLTKELVGYMRSGQSVYVPGSTGGSTGESEVQTQYQDTPINAIYAGLTCMQAYRKENLSLNPPIVANVYSVPLPTPDPFDKTAVIYNFQACQNSSTSTGDSLCPAGTKTISCGQIKLTAPKGDLTALSYLEQGFATIMPSLNSAAYFMVNDPSTKEETVMQDTFNFVGADFLTQLENAYHSYVVQANNVFKSNDTGYGNDFYDDINAYGWISAGNLYWAMAKSHGSDFFNGANKNSKVGFYNLNDGNATVPADPPNISDPQQCATGGNGIYTTAVCDYAGSDGYSNQFIADLGASQSNDGSSGSTLTHSKKYTGVGTNTMSALTTGTFNAMLSKFKGGNNPMVVAQEMGHEIILATQAALALFAVLMVGAAIASGIDSSMSPMYLVYQTTLAFAVPAVTLFGGFLLVMGGTLAVVIPFIPALAYFLSVTAWLVSTVETIVAAPIVAVGVIHPDGQHPVWGKAEPAIMLIISMFLRPSLMVIGLSAGVLLSFITMQFINFGFESAMFSVLAKEPTSIEAAIFLMTYVGLVLACVNKSFSAIDAIPEQVMRWISGGEGAKFGTGQEAMQKLQGSQESQGSKTGESEASTSKEAAGSGDRQMDSDDKRLGRANDANKKGLKTRIDALKGRHKQE